MTDPNENDEQPQRIWTPDPNARAVPAGDPFGLYTGKTAADDDGPDI